MGGRRRAMLRYNPLFFLVIIAVYGANALIPLLALVALTSSKIVLPVLIPGILTKALFEALLLAVGRNRLGRTKGTGPAGDGAAWRHFPYWVFLQIPYMTYIGVAGLWGNRRPWRPPAAEEPAA